MGDWVMMRCIIYMHYREFWALNLLGWRTYDCLLFLSQFNFISKSVLLKNIRFPEEHEANHSNARESDQNQSVVYLSQLPQTKGGNDTAQNLWSHIVGPEITEKEALVFFHCAVCYILALSSLAEALSCSVEEGGDHHCSLNEFSVRIESSVFSSSERGWS